MQIQLIYSHLRKTPSLAKNAIAGKKRCLLLKTLSLAKNTASCEERCRSRVDEKALKSVLQLHYLADVWTEDDGGFGLVGELLFVLEGFIPFVVR